jgi:hypothetical protein
MPDAPSGGVLHWHSGVVLHWHAAMSATAVVRLSGTATTAIYWKENANWLHGLPASLGVARAMLSS